MANLIKEPTLRELIVTGAVRSATLVRTDGERYALELDVGMRRAMVGTKRGTVRTWRHLDTAAGYLRDLGIPQVTLHVV